MRFYVESERMKTRKRADISLKKTAIALAALTSVSSAALACQPIPGLAYSMMSTAATVAIVTQSAAALVVVVLVKSLFFSFKSGIRARDAFLLMMAANVFSTIPGVVGAMALGIGGIFTLVAGAPLYFIYIVPARRIAKLLNKRRISPATVNISMIVATYISAALFVSATSMSSEVGLLSYWAMKIVFTTIGVAVGLAISVGYEETCVSKFYKKMSGRSVNFFDPVLRANVWTALTFAALGAAIAIPQRLSSPDFLILAQRAIRAIFG